MKYFKHNQYIKYLNINNKNHFVYIYNILHYKKYIGSNIH